MKELGPLWINAAFLRNDDVKSNIWHEVAFFLLKSVSKTAELLNISFKISTKQNELKIKYAYWPVLQSVSTAGAELTIFKVRSKHWRSQGGGGGKGSLGLLFFQLQFLSGISRIFQRYLESFRDISGFFYHLRVQQ